MPLGEFDVIARYFSRSSPRSDVLLGVGDDAALLAPPPGQALVAATDTLVEGRHFFPGTPASTIGHQALAVNLSDLAAMGAEPAWALLSLSLPHPPTVPFLFIHGDADPLVPLQQSQKMVTPLKAAGGSAELIVKKGGHPWITLPEEVKIMADWFDQHLSGTKPGQPAGEP